jgi:hypothetical protein
MNIKDELTKTADLVRSRRSKEASEALAVGRESAAIQKEEAGTTRAFLF